MGKDLPDKCRFGRIAQQQAELLVLIISIKTNDMLVEKPYIATIGEGGYCWYNCNGSMINKGVNRTAEWRQSLNKRFQL